MLTVGQFKDEQFKSHTHVIPIGNAAAGFGLQYQSTYYEGQIKISNSGGENSYGSGGAHTHGKQKGVKFIIKVL